MFKHILLAYDGSVHARRAYDVAIEMALKLGAKLEIVQIESTQPDSGAVGGVGGRALQSEMAKCAALALAPLWSQARSLGVKEVSGDVLHGDPAHEIVTYAKLTGCDLIVMGRRGRGRLEGLFLGSVSAHLAGHADCAVLTVK